MRSNMSSICHAGGTACQQPVRWQLSGWGPCSNGCGGGLSTRTVRCVDANTGAERTSCITDMVPEHPGCNNKKKCTDGLRMALRALD